MFFFDPSGEPPAEDPRRAALLALEEGPAVAAARKVLEGREADCRSLAKDRAKGFPKKLADFVAGLNKANASRDWWAFRIADKNPYFVRFPRRLFQLLLIRDAAEAAEGPLWIAASDPLLAEAAAAFANARGGGFGRESLKSRLNRILPGGPAVAFLRAAWKWLKVRATETFRPEAGKRYVVLATLFSHQSFDGPGAYRDTYFGGLAGLLKENGAEVLTFGSLTQNAGKTLRRLRGLSADSPLVPMEAFLGAGALLRLFAKALQRRLFGFPLAGPFDFEGLDAELLIRDDLAANARDSRFFSDLWYYECGKALFDKVPVERLIFPYESRAWERMLTLAAREKGVKVVGYQHSSITESHVNFNLGEGDLKTVPLPDSWLANGDVTRDFLIETCGYPEKRVVLSCALRLLPPAAGKARAGGKVERVLLLFSTNLDESARALRLLDGAFAGGGPEVLIRTHPTLPLSAYLAVSGPVSFRIRREPAWPLARAIEWADAVLFDASTTGLEAVASGAPTVFLDVSVFLSTDPMPACPGLKWTAATSEGLKRALAEIGRLSAEELYRRAEEAAAYCARAMAKADKSSAARFLN